MNPSDKERLRHILSRYHFEPSNQEMARKKCASGDEAFLDLFLEWAIDQFLEGTMNPDRLRAITPLLLTFPKELFEPVQRRNQIRQIESHDFNLKKARNQIFTDNALTPEELPFIGVIHDKEFGRPRKSLSPDTRWKAFFSFEENRENRAGLYPISFQTGPTVEHPNGIFTFGYGSAPVVWNEDSSVAAFQSAGAIGFFHASTGTVKFIRSDQTPIAFEEGAFYMAPKDKNPILKNQDWKKASFE